MTNIIISIKNLYKIFGDNPKNINGCSWENTSNIRGGTPTTWTTTGGSVLSVSSSAQSFTNELWIQSKLQKMYW